MTDSLSLRGAKRRSNLLAYLLCFLSLNAFACTTFMLEKSDTVGKSYDWKEDQAVVMVNKRGIAKVSQAIHPSDKPLSWKSKYGSVTFNSIAREAPLAGLNEAGLVVEIMMGGYGDPPIDNRPTINELQWIQYQLDNYATTAEVVQHADDLRISRAFAGSWVHYLFCDRTQQCGTFEFVNQKRVVHSGNQMVVNTLTNNTYADSIKTLKKYMGFGGDWAIPESPSSLDRFVRASSLAKAYLPGKAKPIPYAFSILDSVTIPNLSQWQIVYALKNRKVHYRTLRNGMLRTIDASQINFNCTSPLAFAIDIHEGQGEMKDSFHLFTQEENEALMLASVSDKFSKEAIQKLAAYPYQLECAE